MPEPLRPSYEFGPFVLDASKRLLLRNGDPVPLAPKVLDTLLALIEHRGDVMSKEQLLSRVWGDTVVEEGGLARNISLLRKTLGEKPDEHRYIVTVPARGYRFVADVREDAASTPHREELSDCESAISQNGESDGSLVRHPPASTAIWKPAAVLSVVLSVGAAALIWPSVSSSFFGSAPLSQARLIRLTSTGLNIDPALSPDGSLLAYASDRARTGSLDIWVQPVRGDTPTRITSGDGDEVEPSFSPDGSLIAFAGGETGGIYTVGALGGEPRQLVRGARTRTPRFSPDGRSILYWIGQTAWVVVPGSGGAGATGTLAIVASNGGVPRVLAREFASARYGVWSPDGTKILFLGERANDGGASLDWYVIAADGEGVVRTGALDALHAARVNGTPIPGAWTAAGVVFTTGEATSNVWQLLVSPQTSHVAGSARRLTFGTALERSAAVSADGHIAFAGVTENVDVWRVPLDPRTGGARGTPERVTEDAAPDHVLNVSANGRTLAFRSSRSGRDEVWLKDLQTGAERQLTHSGARVARISPDGLKVAIAADAGEQERVDLYDLSGRQSSTLCDDCSLSGGWSSDGSRLLIDRPRGASDALVMLDITSRREVEITRHPVWSILQPHFSPDDRWVVFHTTNAPNLRQVYAVPAFRRAPVPVDEWVPIAPDFGIYPRWSSDGAGIYYFSFRDGYMCAWLQPVDPASKHSIGAPRPVQHFHQPRLRAAARASATSDVVDGVLYVTLTETTGNIWMLEASAGSPR